jgi:hypothetical protein
LEVPGLSIFSSGSEKDESEENEFEDEDPEKEDRAAPDARGPQNEASSEVSFYSVFQFTIASEKSSLN